MGEDKRPDNNFEDLRRRAETQVQKSRLEQDVSKLSDEEVRALAHELQVHQAELEMQNHELRRAQIELQESRDKYADLYDFSPVGYFTLDPQGVILEANLSGARLVNLERRNLIKQPFMLVVSPDDHSSFFSHLKRVFETPVKQTCEIKLNNHRQQPIYARLESIGVPDEHGKLATCRVAVSDISEAKQLEQQIFKTQSQVLSSMAEGVCVCDETGKVSFTNAAFELMFGYDRSELSLRKFLFEFEDCLEDESPALLPEAFSQALKKGHWRGDLLGCKKRR